MMDMSEERCSSCMELGTYEFAPEWDTEGRFYYRCSCCGNLKSVKWAGWQSWEQDDYDRFIRQFKNSMKGWE